MIDAPLHRLREFLTLDTTELQALDSARLSRVSFKRRQMITCQGDPVSAIYLLVEGWVGTCVELETGRRQMIDVHLPGDILGLPSVAVTRAAETITALTAATVDVVPIKALAQLFEAAPRLALTLFLVSQHDRVMQMDHLAAVGQTRATQRICGLLLYVYRRLKALDPATDCVIDWPLSQEHIAQGGGLTSIHVNRTFRDLRRRKLIACDGRRIKLLDLERLSELAGLPERTCVHDAPWLSSLRRSVSERAA